MNIHQILEFIRRNATRLGAELAEKALILAIVLWDQNTPAWARAIVLASLTYLLLPFDACPDPVPVVGYGDDLVNLLAAVSAVASVTRPEHVQRARKTVRSVFGE